MRRRPAMIARPARVRIRSRKPCVLDRRRLFGWNVRLLTEYSHYTTSAVHTRRWAGTRGGTPVRRLPLQALPEAGRPGRSTRHVRHAGAPRCRGRATDSDQHNRGRQPAGGPVAPRLVMVSRAPAPVTATRRRPVCDTPGDAPGERRTVIAPLWTGLLASPSLRPGSPGPAARTGRPVRRPPHPSTHPSPLPRPAETPVAGSAPGTPVAVRCRSCTACGHRCGTVVSGCPRRGPGARWVFRPDVGRRSPRPVAGAAAGRLS